MKGKIKKRVRKEDFSRIVAEVDSRIEYLKTYKIGSDYKNGWMGLESGPCCKKCAIDWEKPVGNMTALSGCRDPFQINCDCHISYRKVAADSELHTLENLRAAITCPRSFCLQDCDCEKEGFVFHTKTPVKTH